MLPPEVDGWRRRCATCADAANRGEAESVAVTAIVGKHVAQSDARDVVSALRRWAYDASGDVTGIQLLLPLAEAVGRFGRTPWSHVPEAERRLVADALARVLAEHRPRRCSQGACGLCGVQRALDWYESSMRWPDRSPAPVCGTCRPTYIARRRPDDPDDVGRVVIEIVTGWPVPLGVNAGEVRGYCHTRDADKTGFPEPWAYAPEKLSDLRLETWTARSQYAPEHLRADAEQWHRDALAEQAAQREQEHVDAGTGW